MMEITEIIESKRKYIDNRISKTKNMMAAQKDKLNSLVETNKYFYRDSSPSPIQIATFQYYKKQLEKRGIDVCNPN